MKKTTGYVIITPEGTIMDGSNHTRKRDATNFAEYIEQLTWKDLYDCYYRCQKVEIIPIERKKKGGYHH